MPAYLTEESLGNHLKKIFNADFIHDKPFIGKFRPDYRNDDLKLIVEFDGDRHYAMVNFILRDALKDKQEKELDYRVVRWPYFVQMTSEIAKIFLGVEYEVEQAYPHGFIDAKCVCPADFCMLGIEKFIDDVKKLSKDIQEDIIKSLESKIANARFGWQEVVPDGLMKIIRKS